MEKFSIELTKEQWEEIYQWYLVIKEEHNLKPFEEEAAEKISRTLIEKFGSFR